MPIRRSLEHSRGAEEAVLVEGAGLDLQADGERGAGGFAAGEAAGDADAGDAGEVRGDGVKVFQVHGERVPGFFTNFERRVGSGGADDEIDFLEGSVVVAADQPADLEGL